MKEEKSQCKRNRKRYWRIVQQEENSGRREKRCTKKTDLKKSRNRETKTIRELRSLTFTGKKKRVSVSRGYLIALLKISSGHFAVLLEKPSKWETKPVYLV